MSNNHQQSRDKLSRLSLATEGEESINVLLVEDSNTVRTQLRQFIALLDSVTLIEAGTLAEARAILETRSRDLFCAILDLTLPDATGLDTVEAVRAYNVPIIVLTGSADPHLRQAVLDLRVIDYMFKSGAAAIEDVAYLIGRLRQNQTMPVMVVDASPNFRQHVTGLLAQYRFPILTANNGHEALALLAQNPDLALVITDYQMSEMSGIELVRNIRHNHRREDIAIIALSDVHRPEASAAMLKAGANDYLNKNFQAEEFYCRVVQNTNMVRFVRELRDMANRDYLTRLHNRRHLFHAAEALYAEARAGQRTLAVAMVDADHFKRINDQFGHSAGDEALKQIAKVLRRGAARGDIVARYGGEEFVCVAGVADPAQAAERFEQLRAAIAAIALVWDGAPIALTVSIGTTTTLGNSFAEMIEHADQALFHAKAAGRNRVVDFSSNSSQ